MTIVVLGGGITKEEKLPKQVKKRLSKAIEIFRKEKIDYILTCGKYSFLLEKEERPSITEAELMKKHLIEEGIEEENICLEKKSMDTISNAYFVKTEHFLPKNEKEGTIITSDYHKNRVQYIFEKVFGRKYKLKFIGVPAETEKKTIERQKELIKKAKKLMKGMKDGEHEFLKDKFFEADYYKKERPSWVKRKVSKGQNENPS